MIKRKYIPIVVILGLLAIAIAASHPSCSTLVANPSPVDGADGTAGGPEPVADSGDSSGG